MRPFATSSQAPDRPQFVGTSGNSGSPSRRSPNTNTNEISKIKSDPFEGIDLSSASIESELKRIEAFLTSDSKAFLKDFGKDFGLNFGRVEETRDASGFNTASFNSRENSKVPSLTTIQPKMPPLYEMPTNDSTIRDTNGAYNPYTSTHQSNENNIYIEQSSQDIDELPIRNSKKVTIDSNTSDQIRQVQPEQRLQTSPRSEEEDAESENTYEIKKLPLLGIRNYQQNIRPMPISKPKEKPLPKDYWDSKLESSLIRSSTGEEDAESYEYLRSFLPSKPMEKPLSKNFVDVERPMVTLKPKEKPMPMPSLFDFPCIRSNSDKPKQMPPLKETSAEMYYNIEENSWPSSPVDARKIKSSPIMENKKNDKKINLQSVPNEVETFDIDYYLRQLMIPRRMKISIHGAPFQEVIFVLALKFFDKSPYFENFVFEWFDVGTSSLIGYIKCDYIKYVHKQAQKRFNIACKEPRTEEDAEETLHYVHIETDTPQRCELYVNGLTATVKYMEKSKRSWGNN